MRQWFPAVYVFILLIACFAFLAILSSSAMAGVDFNVANVTNFLTPNGDGLNDEVIAVFDNPKDSAFSGQIFNTKGEVVSSMTSGPIPNSLKWDGKSNGQVVPSDLYYMQIASEGKVWTEFVLVFITENPVVRTIPTLPPQTKSIDAGEATDAMNGLVATGQADPSLSLLVGTTVQIVIRGVGTGSVSVVGGARGFVNPANGEKLSIDAKATAAGTIKTKIFDGKGRLVREYSVATDGTQTTFLQWDGKDSAGRNVPSGVYLIHVDGPGIDTTKRTVIIK